MWSLKIFSSTISAADAAAAIPLVLSLALSGCGSPPESTSTVQGRGLGTQYTVKVVTAQGASEDTETLTETIEAALGLVDQRMSTWRPDSELSAFNRHREDRPFSLSAETFEVLQLAQEISEASHGAFDVTVGPLVNAWGFGPTPRRDTDPTREEINALRELCGFKLLSLDPGERTATKDNPEIYADLSGIAKGWAVDLIALRLREQGYDRFLVEVGGEVRSAGERAEGGAWRLAIESPQPGSRKVQRIVELSGEAMATSGDYRNFYERDGKRYSHTIDPRTGRPVSHSLASATVIHPRCAVADAWATAMMVLGPEEGLRLAEQEGLAVLLLVYDVHGVSELESSAFGRFAGQER